MVQSALQKNYSDLGVNGQVIPGSTGSFEVILKKNGKEKLVHSNLDGKGMINKTNLDAFLEKFDNDYKSL